MPKQPKPTAAEVDAAVRLLERANGFHTVVLACDPDNSIYITAFSHTVRSAREQRVEAERKECQPGTVEYGVSDGPPGDRSHSYDFYDFYEALECFKGVQREGWQNYGKAKPRKKRTPAASE